MSRVLILGGGSFVARPLAQRLTQRDYEVIAGSRANAPDLGPGVLSATYETITGMRPGATSIISLCPIWVVPDLLRQLEMKQLDKIIALSSSSVTLKEAANQQEAVLLKRLQYGETELQRLANKNVTLTLFRPTMVFGYGRDQNVSRIARLVKRNGVAVFMGPAAGLRQPLHAKDLAAAIEAALRRDVYGEIALGGATQISYREMVKVIAKVHKIRYRSVTLPRPLITAGLSVLKRRKVWRDVSLAMFDRMEKDLVVNNSHAKSMLDIIPQTFDVALKDDLEDRSDDTV